MIFTLTININKPEPDFGYEIRRALLCGPDADISEQILQIRNEWRIDQLSDFADVLRLVGNRIMRGEKSGKVRDLNGNNVGEFGVEL